MKNNKNLYLLIRFILAGIWFVNGFFCKVLNLVPRHREIVARILHTTHADSLTTAIGILEICLAIFILSGRNARAIAILQIALIAIMNVFEFFLAHDLLLWGSGNAFFAFCLMCVIYFHEFYLRPVNLLPKS